MYKRQVLFINKCDVLSGDREVTDQAAKEHYQELIMALRGLWPSTHIVVGSVRTDEGLVKLYSLLVHDILAREGWVPPIGRCEQPDVKRHDEAPRLMLTRAEAACAQSQGGGYR